MLKNCINLDTDIDVSKFVYTSLDNITGPEGPILMVRPRRLLDPMRFREPTGYNKIAVRISTNRYLAKAKAARSYITDRMSEASNQQAELFRIVRDLSGIGLGEGPPASISPDQFAAFFKSKVEAILRDLSPF